MISSQIPHLSHLPNNSPLISSQGYGLAEISDSEMQGDSENKLNPDRDLYSEDRIILDFDKKMKLTCDLQDFCEDQDSDSDEEEDNDGEFSFICAEAGSTPIAAEDAFINGKIKPVFPFFSRDVFLSAEESEFLGENLPMRPPVSKVFMEAKDSCSEVSPFTSGHDEIAAPCCDWSERKAVEVSPEGCKKSNSTGFSKIWRFKDFMGRSNSDGRDAFVFLNISHAPSKAADPASSVTVIGTGEMKARKDAPARKGSKIKTAPLSAHAVYLRSKAKEEEKRRSYLPYRPELMGFFTNVNSGLSKNVHPF